MNFFKDKRKKQVQLPTPVEPREKQIITQDYSRACFEVGQLEDAIRRSTRRLEELYKNLDSLYNEATARDVLDNEAKAKAVLDAAQTPKEAGTEASNG
jgi:hypothetical protein